MFNTEKVSLHRIDIFVDLLPTTISDLYNISFIYDKHIFIPNKHIDKRFVKGFDDNLFKKYKNEIIKNYIEKNFNVYKDYNLLSLNLEISEEELFYIKLRENNDN